MLETSHLRCFVAVARARHFGRAAKTLHMTQPPLSRQIQLLERALGCVLLHRNSRGVELTAAGADFLPEAQKILGLIDRAGTLARDVAEGRRGAAQVGFTAVSAYEVLPDFIHALRRDHADIRLELHEMVSRDQVAALRSGAIDVGLSRAHVALSEYDHCLIARERLVVALPHDHALCSRDSLNWSDLHGQDFLMYENRDAQYFHDLVAGRLTLEGARPNVVQRLTQIHTILALVRAGVGVAVVPTSSRRLNMFGVAYREIDAARPLTAELMLVWARGNRNPVLPMLIAAAKAIADRSADFTPRRSS
ncbi:LysR family transcriptional regulator [Roseicitreum antarcticum]|uniref:Transcriptional regulator, LysR family n=1 Tax=Roseicitreum antarcticum TaxID=564137 RepID=A0A1H2VEU9_9RHOB|nr:LysR family transcriptional regulator [Roseicitreum antarcticum]SDW66848.1 transcriptional regulator, LysR family [Roseicitreum antarcticum]